LLVEHEDAEDLLVVGDQAYVAANYEREHPMGLDLLWSRPDWEASLRRCTELGRRHDATVIFGHDPDQFDRFDELL
jgi:glyoxylase-like metal-dependent hydrolase (beta-lactamase superfamily II)